MLNHAYIGNETNGPGNASVITKKNEWSNLHALTKPFPSPRWLKDLIEPYNAVGQIFPSPGAQPRLVSTMKTEIHK